MFGELFRAAVGRAAELSSEWSPSLSSVEPGAWERISRDCGLYLSRPFLRALEGSGATSSSYLLLRRPDGELAAGLPLYRWDGGRDPGLDHYEPFGSGASWVLGPRARRQPWLPTLLAGTRAGYATQFPIDAISAEERRQVTARLLGEAAARAEASRAASLAAMWLSAETAANVAGCLARPELLILAGPNCVLDLPGDSFDDYLAQLSSARRLSVRHERSRFAQSGLEVELADLHSCVEELAPLAAQVQARYHHQMSPAEIASDLHSLALRLNSESRVLLCRQGGRTVGFALLFSWAGTLYGRQVGFDYGALAGSDAYFNLAFYLPIELALEEGLHRIHLGMASWRPKVFRGARLDPTWTLACPPRSVRGAFSRAAREQDGDAGSWWQGQFPGQIDLEKDPRWSRAGLLGNGAETTARQWTG